MSYIKCNVVEDTGLIMSRVYMYLYINVNTIGTYYQVFLWSLQKFL